MESRSWSDPNQSGLSWSDRVKSNRFNLFPDDSACKPIEAIELKSSFITVQDTPSLGRTNWCKMCVHVWKSVIKHSYHASSIWNDRDRAA